jgi:phage gpG-like protein
MARLSVSVRLTGAKGIFSDVRKRVRKPVSGKARKPVAQALRNSVLRDFRRGGHHGSTGAFRAWTPAKEFGECQPSAKTLGGTTGSMGQAWKNARAIPSATGVAIVASHPGMRIHKEGGLVKAKKRTASGRLSMVVFFGLKCGVWISERKALAGMRIPARPFADKNPELARDIEKIVAGVIRG